MSRPSKPMWIRAFAMTLLLASVPAAAHEVRPGLLQMDEREPGRFAVTWKQPVQADRRLAIDVSLPAACAAQAHSPPEHTGAALIQRWEVLCDLRSGTVIVNGLSATLTDVLVRISYLDGSVLSEILRASVPSLDLADPTPGVGAYFLLGVEHLALGVDHILFVVGLVLFIRHPWALAKTVTAFTVAHSVTLAMSVLGIVSLPQGPVEAMIALSILFLARELMVPSAQRSYVTRVAPWSMAFAFGLLHGFGFAGVLQDIGLPGDQLAASLLLFNLGIEAGQLGVIALLLCATWLGHRLADALPATAGGALARSALPYGGRVFSAIMGCVAGFWTIDRMVGLV